MGRTAVSKTVRRGFESLIPRQIKDLAAKLGLCEPPKLTIIFPEEEYVLYVWEDTLDTTFCASFTLNENGLQYTWETPTCAWGGKAKDVAWPPPDIDKPAVHAL